MYEKSRQLVEENGDGFCRASTASMKDTIQKRSLKYKIKQLIFIPYLGQNLPILEFEVESKAEESERHD
jgi:hypothetical protein